MFYYPFDALLKLQSAMDQAMSNDFFAESTTSRGVFPAINLFRDGEDYVLTAELPGVAKENLHLEVRENLLRISGERAIHYGKDESIHRLERGGTKFDRSIKLPYRVQPNKIKADLRDGVLMLHLERAEEDKPRKISIN